MSKKAINKSRRENKNAKNLDKEIKEKEIDYEKLAEAIVKAQIKAKEIEEQEAEKQIKEKKEKWNEKTGYTKVKNAKGFLKCVGYVKFFFRILLFGKKYEIQNTNLLLVKSLYICIIQIMKMLLYGLTIFLGISIFYSFSKKTFEFNWVWIPHTFLSFLLARIFSLAAHEVEHIDDKNYMLALFSAITSFIAMVLAIIALFLR